MPAATSGMLGAGGASAVSAGSDRYFALAPAAGAAIV